MEEKFNSREILNAVEEILNKKKEGRRTLLIVNKQLTKVNPTSNPLEPYGYQTL